MAEVSKPVVATTKTPSALVELPASDLPLSLHEFCSRLSSRITKPELIAAFEHTESAAGHLSDTDAAFAARFDDFANLPA